MDKFYRHIRPEVVNKTNKNKTVAGIFDRENHMLKIGVSVCSNNDNYNKKIGRTISEGRALKKPEFTTEVENYPQAIEAFNNYCATLGSREVNSTENVSS